MFGQPPHRHERNLCDRQKVDPAVSLRGEAPAVRNDRPYRYGVKIRGDGPDLFCSAGGGNWPDSADLGGAASRQLSGDTGRDANLVAKAPLDPNRTNRGAAFRQFTRLPRPVLRRLYCCQASLAAAASASSRNRSSFFL